MSPAPAPAAGTPSPEDPPAPAVTIRVRVPAAVTGGKEIEYRMTVENASQAPAHHVLVRNPVPANAKLVRASPEPNARGAELLWQLGTLSAGSYREIVLVLAATGPGDVDNCARVQFEHGECVRTHVARPDLRLEKNGPDRAVVGDTLAYRLTVTNAGDADAAGVALTDPLAAGLEPAEGKAPLKWDIGALPAGQSRSVGYRVVARAPGRLCNRAVATADGGLRTEAESCVAVTQPKVSLAAVGPARRYVHAPAAYRLTLGNPGTAPATGVVVENPLPAGARLVSAPGAHVEGGAVRWDIGIVAPGESRTLELVLAPEEAGTICNRASARADRGLTAGAEACTEVLGVPGVLLEMVDSDDPIEVGGETTYRVTVRNQGTQTVTNLRLEATAPEQLEIVRAAGPADSSLQGARLTFDPLSVRPGAEARYTIRARGERPGDARFKVDLTADQLPAGPVHEEESTTVYAPDAAAPPIGAGR